MKLVPILFAGVAALATAAGQDASTDGPAATSSSAAPSTTTASTTVSTTTELVCAEGLVKVGHPKRPKSMKCLTQEEYLVRAKSLCDSKDAWEWVESLDKCARTVESLEQRCTNHKRTGEPTGKVLVEFKKRNLDAKRGMGKNKKTNKQLRKAILGSYKCMTACVGDEQRFGNKRQCGTCDAIMEEHPEKPAQEVVKVNGIRTCKVACSGLSKRDKKKGTCVHSGEEWQHPVAELVPETDGLPSALQELLAGSFSRLHTAAGKRRRRHAKKPIAGANPTIVRLAFHASMGKADTCLDYDAPFNNGLQDLHAEYKASHTLFKRVWAAFNEVSAKDPQLCKTRDSGECKIRALKNANGKRMTNSRGAKMMATQNVFYTKNNVFKWNHWQKAACTNFEQILDAHADAEQLWADARLPKKEVLNLLCDFVSTHLFPANIGGPEASIGEAYKTPPTAERAMSMSDYFAFMYSEALQRTLPIKYNKDCDEVKFVLKKKKLNEDGTESSIKCYDPAQNDNKEIQYMVKRYGRTDPVDCAAEIPDSAALPDGGQNFVFNADRMAGLFDGLDHENVAILLGAHTLGAFHADTSGFRTATWVNCPGNLNVKFFQLMKREKWTPFFNADNSTTSFRMVRTAEQCAKLDTQQGKGCTSIMQDGVEYQTMSREIKRLDFDRERGAMPIDLSLVYNFDASTNEDFYSNGFPLQTQDADGNAFSIGRTVSSMTADEDRSPAWPIIERYVNHTNKASRLSGAVQFILDIMPAFEKMIDNGYASDFSGDATKPALQAKPAGNTELFDACMKLYADGYKNAKHQITGGEPRNREKERMQHCYHFDEDKLDDDDGFNEDDPLDN